MIREGRALGMSDSDVLLYAKISARTGVRVSFDKGKTLIGRRKGTRELVYADGFYDPATNEICVNPDGKRSADKLLIHELAHAIYGGEKGMRLAKRNAKSLSAEEKKAISDRYAEVDRTDEIELFDEYNAHYAEGILGNAETLERLLDDAPTVKDHILDFLRGAKGDTDAQRSAAARRLFFKYKRLFDKFAQQNAQNIAAERLPTVATDTEKKTPRGEAPEANGVTRTNNEKMQVSGKRLALSKGKAERLKNDLVKLGTLGIRLDAGEKSIRILTDKFTQNKNIFSAKGRNMREVNARIKAIPHFAEILRNCTYEGSDTEIRGLENEAKKGVVAMHRFKGSYEDFDIEAVVRDKGAKQFLYEIKFIEKEKSSQQSMTDESASPAPLGDAENALIITQSKKKSNPSDEISSKNPTKKRLALPENDVSVDNDEEDYNNNLAVKNEFDLETFDISCYNEIELPSYERDRIQSEALIWDAAHRNIVKERTLSNGITYQYIIDKDGIVHVYKRKSAKNIHLNGDFYADTNREKFDTIIEELRLGQGNDGEYIDSRGDRRNETEANKLDNTSLRSKGRGDGAGYFKAAPYAHRSEKKIIGRQTDESIEWFPVVDTFTDVRGKKRNVRKLNHEYMVEGTMRIKRFFPTVQEAIKGENDNIIQRYARKYDRPVSWVKSRLENDPDFLKKEIRKGKRFALPDMDGSVDIYTEEEYNNFGWARDADAISVKELDDLYSKIQEKGTLRRFKQSVSGEAIVEVNNKPNTILGANNVFVFVKGTKNNPEITRVVRINFFDEESIDIFRKDIYNNNGHRTLEAYARGIGEEFLRYYDRSDNADYRAYTEKSRSQRSRSEGAGDSGAYRNGDFGSGASEKTNGNVKFALPVDSDKETIPSSVLPKQAVPHTDKGRAEYWKEKAKENESRAKVLGNISALAQRMKDLKLGTYHNATQMQNSKNTAEVKNSIAISKKVCYNNFVYFYDFVYLPKGGQKLWRERESSRNISSAVRSSIRTA